ncbi:MAG: cytochrome C [Chrysiogenetes bacterium]|nr:cytochrome C [Chrysiogenetes bacterium]
MPGQALSKSKTSKPLERGEYLVRLGGCNDCHTPGYSQSNGTVPRDQWLTGVPVGFRGPWGTTYPVNLRYYMERYSEDEWVSIAKTLQTRPPMPWYDIQKVPEEDLRALYQLLRSLGPVGEPTPAYLPPDQEPATPFIVFVPQAPAAMK